MIVILNTQKSFGAELMAAVPLSFAAKHWFQLILYQGDEVVPGSGGQDLYEAGAFIEPSRRAAATGRSAVYRVPVATAAATPFFPIHISPPFRRIAIGLTSSLNLDIWDFSRCFSLSVYWRGRFVRMDLNKPKLNIYWDRHGHFQIPLSVIF
jgi:hypothetical protein